MDRPRFLPTLHLLVRLLQTLEQSDHEALASGPGQGRILAAVLADPGIAPSVLVRRFGLTPSTVSQAVHRLRTTGYVELAPDRRDRRRLALRPTAQGRALAPLFAMHAEHRERVAHTGLSDRDIRQLDRLLYHVAASVGNELRVRGVR